MCGQVRASQVALVVKNLPPNVRGARDEGLIPGSGRSPGGGRGSPMDRGAWQATAYSVAQSWTRLKRLSVQAHEHAEWYLVYEPVMVTYYYCLILLPLQKHSLSPSS